jgi:hypothetical protein
MADRPADLEVFRQNFLNQLRESQPDLSGYQDFLRYWKTVEGEAAHTEDIGMLDGWVKDLARDKEKVSALCQRTDTMSSDKGGDTAIQALSHILKMVLGVLDAIERRLRGIRDDRMSALASMLWKGGPGTLVKPKDDDKDKKGEKKKPAAGGAIEAAVPVKAVPPPEKKRDKEKKMER